MILRNALTNRQSQPGSSSFSVRGKRFKQPPDHLRWYSSAGVFHFRHNSAVFHAKAKKDFTAIRFHRFGGIVHKVIEKIGQSYLIDSDIHRRSVSVQLDYYFARNAFSL